MQWWLAEEQQDSRLVYASWFGTRSSGRDIGVSMLRLMVFSSELCFQTNPELLCQWGQGEAGGVAREAAADIGMISHY